MQVALAPTIAWLLLKPEIAPQPDPGRLLLQGWSVS
jgi:hypothetical protein